MKIVIIGSGLIGVATAYCLSVAGHDVTVLDRESGAGRGASFANGGLLVPSMSEPWNAPGVWRHLLASIGRSDAPLQLRLRSLPDIARWGIGFLRNSSTNAYLRNAHNNLTLAQYSVSALANLRDTTKIQYGRTARGSLRIFRDRNTLNKVVAGAQQLRTGLSVRQLSPREVLEVEPALAPIAQELIGGIYFNCDEAGDAHTFCVELAGIASTLGVKFVFDTEVLSLQFARNRVIALNSSGEKLGANEFKADCYVIAAGSYSPLLLRKLGIYLPVQPVKGYSVTLGVSSERGALAVPLVDDQMHAAITPLGNTLRAVSTAEFAGYDSRPDPRRFDNLVALVRRILPESQLDYSSVRSWCGLRATSIDGVPAIGPTRIENLFVNTGHGHLGWTMVAGSAQLLSDLICNQPPTIDPTPYSPLRFGARSAV